MTYPYTLSVEACAGQLFFPAAFINDTEEQIQEIERLITEEGVGGLTFFHSRASAATNYEKKIRVTENRKSYERLQELILRYQKIAPVPLLISIDAEWGLAMRVEQTPQYPYALTLGALPKDRDDLIEAVGLATGQDLKRIGIDLNLAPVADINDNPMNPVIGYRSFGGEREAVTRKAAAFMRGMTKAGVLNSIKHFPGHGNTQVDSHLGLPVLEKDRDTLYREELYPFKKLIEQGADTVMVGHLMVPALSTTQLPATLNPDIIQGILRTEFGFEGVVISDALNMRSVRDWFEKPGELELAAFKAGNDALCFSEHVKEGKERILAEMPSEVIQQSALRILKLKERAGLFSKRKAYSISAYEDFSESIQLNRKIAQQAITLLSDSPIPPPKPGNILYIAGEPPSESRFPELWKQEIGSVASVQDLKSNGHEIDPVYIALYPPRVKPVDAFGLSQELIDQLNYLLKTRKITLFVFGNPYVLQWFPEASRHSVILAYQSFPEFQEATWEILMGKVKANGIVPVRL